VDGAGPNYNLVDLSGCHLIITIISITIIATAPLLACMHRIVPPPLFRTKSKKSIDTSAQRAGRVARAGHLASRQKYWMVRRPAPHARKAAAV